MPKEVKEISEFIGSNISIPREMAFEVQNKRIEFGNSTPDYTIVSFIDSDGCTACKMRIRIWSQLIDEYKALKDKDVRFLMILESSKKDELIHSASTNNFLHPICFDSTGIFKKNNFLPKNKNYHTFLLDANGSVILAGNPAANPKIRRSYQKLLNSLCDSPNPGKANYQPICMEHSKSLGIHKVGDTIAVRFSIINRNTYNLTVKDIVTSSKSITANIEHSTLKPNVPEILTAIYVPDSIGESKQHIDIFCNGNEQTQQLTINAYIN